MKKTVFLLTLSCWSLLACKKEKETPTPTISKTQMLTAGDKKVWKYISYPSTPSNMCTNAERYQRDNSYTFYADQKMTFDRGTITEEGNCSDISNLEGTWAFSTKEDSLSVYVTKNLDRNLSLDKEKLFTGNILSISENKLVLVYQQDSIVFTPR